MDEPSPSDSKVSPASAYLSSAGRTGLIVLFATLVVWVLFWQAALPLDGPSTVVVALALTLSAAALQFLWAHLRRKAPPPRDTRK